MFDLDTILMISMGIVVVSFIVFRKRLTCLPMLALGLFFTGFLALGIYQWSSNVVTSSEAENWPTTPGKVTVSEIRRSTDSDGNREYSPIVNYTYTVNDKQYTGYSVTVSDSAASFEYAHKVVSGYPLGEQVKVYWDPNDPQLSLLEPGDQIRSQAYFQIGGMLFMLILVVGFIGLSLMGNRE